METINIYSS